MGGIGLKKVFVLLKYYIKHSVSHKKFHLDLVEIATVAKQNIAVKKINY